METLYSILGNIARLQLKSKKKKKKWQARVVMEGNNARGMEWNGMEWNGKEWNGVE